MRVTPVQTGTNTISTLSCIDVSIIGKSLTLKLIASYSLSDKEALTKGSYKFKVKNNCSTYVEYKIVLSVLDTSTLVEEEYVKPIFLEKEFHYHFH